ncbi:DUF58 domain-containing protein [Lignipirellula cremea]|uniref:DUF58 domain-containing protein n=1 Tax=Lignipirellula cremea TaxID=2528010 RepID=UPI0011A9EE00|nr:DUF58 domain-containing protein [Lignipirellula cremea]
MEKPSPKFLSPQNLAKLHGLQLRARHIVEGYVAGLHRSPFHGFSIEFAEHREYSPGDDLRYVDWKVFGRTDKVYLKQYEDETNLVCYLVLDISESMLYKGPGDGLSKLEYAQCMAAAIAWLVLHQQDAVSLITFDSEIRRFVQPSSNPSHIRQILHVLETVEPAPKTSLGPIFHDLSERLKKRGVVILLSDLFNDINSMMAGLKHFRHRRHDVVMFHTLDAAELDFPFDNPTLFKGLEDYPEMLADPRALRTAYLKEFNAYLQQVQTACRSQQIDYRLNRTDASFDTVLSTYLAGRQSRIR